MIICMQLCNDSINKWQVKTLLSWLTIHKMVNVTAITVNALMIAHVSCRFEAYKTCLRRETFCIFTFCFSMTDDYQDGADFDVIGVWGVRLSGGANQRVYGNVPWPGYFMVQPQNQIQI